jgi:hypothetical protein
VVPALASDRLILHRSKLARQPFFAGKAAKWASQAPVPINESGQNGHFGAVPKTACFFYRVKKPHPDPGSGERLSLLSSKLERGFVQAGKEK